MRGGLTARMTAAILTTVVVTLIVFSTVVAGVTRRELVDTGTRVDRATAWRLVPWVEEYYRRRGEWTGLNQVLRSTMPGMNHGAHMMNDGSMMGDWSMDERGGMMRRGMRRPERSAPVPGDAPGNGGAGGGALPDTPSPFLDRPIVVTDAAGTVVASSGNVSLHGRPSLDKGIPVGSGDTPYGYVFVGSMLTTDDNPVRETLMRSLVRSGTVAALFVLLGATAMSILWSRWLLGPIRALDTASRSIAAGEYGARVPEPAGDHELTTLARSFNTMATEVEKQEATRRRFVSDAAHELRTPITLMTARLEMMRDGVYPTTRDQWDALHKGVDRIAALVNDLQTLARLDAGRVEAHPAPTSLAELLEDVRQQFLPAADPRTIAIRISGPEEDRSVDIDGRAIHQALSNLVSNALRHTPDGRSIRMEWRTVGSGSVGHLGRDTVIVAVENEGKRIPVEERDRVFDRFVRLDADRNRAHGGSGLGLSIVRRLVALHGGTVTCVEPTWSDGARFEIRLPCVPGEPIVS